MSEADGSRLEGLEGEVKWFDPRKGFGFIIGPGGQDIFVHFTAIEGDGFKVLKDHTRVEYDAERGERGWKATRVAKHETVEISVLPRRGQQARTPRR